MSELKPCPCGSASLYETKLCDARKTYELGNDSTCQHVICESCGFNAPADAWNTRHIPEGYALVPVEPSDAMIEALYGPWLSQSCHDARKEAYKAMITAAIEDGQR